MSELTQTVESLQVEHHAVEQALRGSEEAKFERASADTMTCSWSGSREGDCGASALVPTGPATSMLTRSIRILKRHAECARREKG